MTLFVSILSISIRFAWSGVPGQKERNLIYIKVILLCVRKVGENATKDCVYEGHLPINSSTLGTKYEDIGVTPELLHSLSSQ